MHGKSPAANAPPATVPVIRNLKRIGFALSDSKSLDYWMTSKMRNGNSLFNSAA